MRHKYWDELNDLMIVVVQITILILSKLLYYTVERSKLPEFKKRNYVKCFKIMWSQKVLILFFSFVTKLRDLISTHLKQMMDRFEK